MASIVRSVKNVTKGYSHVQVKVREATSNDAWGPTGAQMKEISEFTMHGSTEFYEVMDMLDKRMNDKGKNWRHVLKSLKVLDYCLHEGSELVVTWSRNNIYVIKTLREFQYIEDDNRDVGADVRASAKQLTSLILDDELLREERGKRKEWKSRVVGISDYDRDRDRGEPSSRRRNTNPRPRHDQDSSNQEDWELKMALEASKNQEEEDKRRRQSTTVDSQDTDDDLAKAIRLSKEEEDLRKRELEQSSSNNNNSNSQDLLIDDGPAPNQPQMTGYNQGYQQQGAVDWFGNPLAQQQPQSTGFLNNAYSSFQPQMTGYQPQMTGYQQTGMNQSQYQQPQYMAMQNTIQPQTTAFNNNPYAQSSFQRQQQQIQPQQTAWADNSFQQAAEPLKPLPTGSNNPFAQRQNIQQQPQKTAQPSLNTIAEQRTAMPNPIMNYTAPVQPQQTARRQDQQMQDPQRARLNALLASGEGMDTFGNTGDMRIPAQHTTPGIFVNSAGQNLNKLHTAQTGNNPFFNQQFTGAPGQQYSNMPTTALNPFPTGSYNPGQRPNQGGNNLIDI